MTKEEKLRGINPMAYPGIKGNYKQLNISIVFNEVSDYFEIDPEELKQKSQLKEIIIARHTFYYFARIFTNATLSYIGSYSSKGWKASHSNVYTSANKVQTYVGFDPTYTKAVADINQRLKKLII
jgi:chromosomal replication initiation ATPase DnaA